MKRVWKCDFCCHTEKLIDDIKEHELNCFKNPKFKNCHSCNNFYTRWESEYCKKDLDVFDGQDDGNCSGWETDNVKLLRKIKLGELNMIK